MKQKYDYDSPSGFLKWRPETALAIHYESISKTREKYQESEYPDSNAILIQYMNLTWLIEMITFMKSVELSRLFGLDFLYFFKTSVSVQYMESEIKLSLESQTSTF